MKDAERFSGEDKFIMGVTVTGGQRVFAYDREAMLENRTKLLMEDDPTLEREEAWFTIVEDYDFNTVSAYVGPGTPVCIDTDMDPEMAGDLFDGELGPSPMGCTGFLGIAEGAGISPCYAFDTDSDYRPIDGQTVMYVDTVTDLSEWLD